MNDIFVARSVIAAVAIFCGCFLIGIGSDAKVACVFGGIALLCYSTAVMLTMPKKPTDHE